MMKRYILFTFLLCSCFVNNVVNAQLRDFQMRGLEKVAPIDTLWILSVDTTTGSATKNLGKWRNYEDLLAAYDTDWLKYRTGTLPNNTDTIYHNGIVNVGMDTTYSGTLNVLGRLDLRYPGFDNHNIVIGKNALLSTSTGNIFNLAIGIEALRSASGVQYSFALGDSALYSATTGDFNTALGSLSLKNLTTGSSNTAIGQSSLYTSASLFNTAIGRRSGFGGATNYNTLIGYDAGYGGVTSNNTIIGAEAGFSTPVSNNVFIGYQAGRTNTGSGNIFIGKESGENETGSNLLYIENSNSTTPLIKGDFSADTLRVNGDLSVRDADSGASTDSVLVWTPTTGRVKMRNAAALGGATNLTIGGSGPSYTVESSTGTDVTITPDIGISLTESPANTLVISNTGAAAAENSSTATTHSFDVIDGTSSSVGSLTLSEGTGITLTTTGTTGAGIVTIASSITDTDDQNLTIEGVGPTYDIAINDGTDVTIQGGGIVTLSESPANTLVITATEVGTMANWLLAASGTGGTETVTTGETVTFSETTGLDATRSTNTVSYALSIDEFSTDATIEEDELLLAYDPSGTNHELIDVNNLPYVTAEVDGSTTNELNTIQEGDVTVQTSNSTIDFGSLFDVATDGAGEVNVDIDLSEAGIDPGTEGDEYVIIYDPSTATEERVLITSVTGGFDGNGIYDGDGTTPSDVDVTVTDSIEFNGTLKIINDANDYVGIGAQSPIAKLHVRGDNSIAMLEQTGAVSSVDLKTRSNISGVTSPFVLGVYNKDTGVDISGDYYQIGNMTFSKNSDAGGAINFNIGYDSTNLDGVLQIKSRETGATDGFVNVVGGLRYKWTTSASASYTLNTGDYGLSMTTTGAKTATIPDAVTGIVGQELMVFNSSSSGDVTITITGGSGDTIYGDPILNINESCKVICVAANKWIINN